MIIQIANPIYDTVFKFLMEDDRIAKTILSALLKKDVLDIKVRPHEYSNQTREKVSMFRIDFAATVREGDGSPRLILVELQKTWLETETLRFRQYLGTQYSDRRNIRQDSPKGFALPMVTIYLLGHRVGDIDVPVLYVNHKSYDYDGNEVTRGMPDPFIDSLVHNSIIVQIPLLHGQVNNRLEKVLSVFDQTKANTGDRQVLSLDEGAYEGDASMEYIVRRLTQAAANSEMRQDMNVEDEYYKALEDRDTAIMNRDKTISEQNETISTQGQKITEQNAQISAQGQKITEQGQKITEQGQKINEQNETISAQSAQLSAQSAQLSAQSEQISALAKALRAKGMTVEQVAGILGTRPDELAGILGGH